MLEKQYQDLLREYDSIESEHTIETTRLKEEITSLRAEMEGILQELQVIMDHKLSLELEIAAYRKLLESEESRYVNNSEKETPFEKFVFKLFQPFIFINDNFLLIMF